MTGPSQLRAASIGKEAAYGQATAPTCSIPLTSCVPTDSHVPQADESWQGSAASSYGHAPGPTQAAVALAGHVYADTIGFPLAGILGDLVTNLGTVNQHSFSLQNLGQQQPPSYTLYAADGIDCVQYAGLKFDSLQISSSGDGTLDWTGTGVCLPGLDLDTAPTPAFSSAPMFPGWAGRVTIGGVGDGTVLASTVTISRTVVPQRNVNGQQSPYNARSEEVTVAGTLSLALTSDAYRQAFLAGTPTSVDVLYSQGSGAGLQSVRLHSSLVALTSAPRSYGSQWVELDLAWTADATHADAGASAGRSPIKAVIQNAVAAGVYA